jgi:hypothetical protein
MNSEEGANEDRAAPGQPVWKSRHRESNADPTLRRHVHYPLCYGESGAHFSRGCQIHCCCEARPEGAFSDQLAARGKGTPTY